MSFVKGQYHQRIPITKGQQAVFDEFFVAAENKHLIKILVASLAILINWTNLNPSPDK